VKVPSGLRSGWACRLGQLIIQYNDNSRMSHFSLVIRAVRGVAALGCDLAELVLGEVGEVGGVGVSHCVCDVECSVIGTLCVS
jgi:hypothetical protein